ncbi:MAG TPA: hypothetical protein VFE33_17545 [Thermoanaerobaculia bacterium]|nr:hypothetical protein [Thermoanaerobaculia bacterium]
MSGKNSRRLGRVLVLALALGLAGAWPGVARASGRGEARVGAQQEGLLASAWQWLARWSGSLPGAQSLSRLWAAEGPGLDPNGGHASTGPTTHVGPGLDPDGGRSTVSPTTDMGPGLDPDGHH